MKITLVYPPTKFGKKRGFGFPPLGILYIASFLRQKWIDVRVIDAFIEGYAFEELKKEILKDNPDIIGFSLMTCQINPVLSLIKELKKIKPSSKIIIGGPHISSTKDELFNFTTDADFLCYGEGENVMLNLVNTLEKNLPLENIENLIYKKNGRTIINKQASPIENLDSLPFPDLNLVNIKKYDSYYAKSLPVSSIMASRGCPFACTFCDTYATHGRKLRLRSPKNIVDEFEKNFKEHGVACFVIKDSTFTINKNWVREMCTEIKKRGLKINWTCNTRVDMVDEDILRVMKDAGCYLVLFGLESGSQRVLNKLRKNITLEQIKKAIQICNKINLDTVGYFIIGSPEETEKDAIKTIEMAKKLKLYVATFGVMIAYPGTEIYTWAIKNNALEDKFWYMKDNLKISNTVRDVDGNLNLENFPRERQTAMVKKATKSFYLRPSFIIKHLLKFRTKQDVLRTLKAASEIL